MIETIIITLIFLFLIINISFFTLLKRIQKPINSSSEYLKFSIIIAAKDEVNNVAQLINSLQNLEYPQENFEVIIIDDGSADETYIVTEELIKGKCNFNLFRAEEKEFPAKKGALSFGIKKSKNPFILITDADCIPGKDWLKSYSAKFNSNMDFAFGNAPFIQRNFLINKISCFENLRSTILSFSASEIGIPYSASARNFGFKKSSFEKIKGYSNTTEILSGDDDLLLREAVKNNLKIGTLLTMSSFVYSSTKNNFKEYFNQKARHTKASFYYLPGRQLGLASWHLLNLFLLFSPLLFFSNGFFALLIVLKLLIDYINR